jgi:predicted O-linked N-acetylglucosamine transferase (SPINDLY family)
VQEYKRIAISYALSPPSFRQHTRAQLHASLLHSPLFDMPRLLRNLEQAYELGEGRGGG